MRNEYYRIMSALELARRENNSRRIKLWLTKLQKWQASYGAYQPINMGGDRR